MVCGSSYLCPSSLADASCRKSTIQQASSGQGLVSGPQSRAAVCALHHWQSLLLEQAQMVMEKRATSNRAVLQLLGWHGCPLPKPKVVHSILAAGVGIDILSTAGVVPLAVNDGNLQSRRDPFPEFGVAIGERKTATAQAMVRSRHVRPDSGGGIHLQIAVIQGAHILFTPDKGHARAEGTAKFAGFDVRLEPGIVTQGQSLTIEIAHLAV